MNIQKINTAISPKTQAIETNVSVPQRSFKDTLSQLFQSIEKDFGHSQSLSKDLMKTLPHEHRAILQSQVYISDFQFKVEMMTRVADGLQQSIKKLQQQN